MREAKKSESVGGKPTSRNRELCGGDFENIESTVRKPLDKIVKWV